MVLGHEQSVRAASFFMQTLLPLFCCCLCCIVAVVNSTLSQTFLAWSNCKYGPQITARFARHDLGASGSFGGDGHRAGKRIT